MSLSLIHTHALPPADVEIEIDDDDNPFGLWRGILFAIPPTIVLWSIILWSL